MRYPSCPWTPVPLAFAPSKPCSIPRVTGLAAVALAAALAAVPAQAVVAVSAARGAVALRTAPAPDAQVSGNLAPGDIAEVACRAGAEPERFFVRVLPGGPGGWVLASEVAYLAAAAETARGDGSGDHATSPTLRAGSAQYVGTRACRPCHLHELRIHLADPHRRALAGLRTPAARAAGEKRGVANPDREARCVRCHVTAYGARPEQLAATFDASEAVGCEACHGPGSDYMDPRIHGVDRAAAIAAGMTDLSTLDRQAALCVACHNDASPTYKRFDLGAFSELVRHWPLAPPETWREYFRRQVDALPAGGALGAAAVAALPVCPTGGPPPAPAPAATASTAQGGAGTAREPRLVTLLGPGIDPPLKQARWGKVAFPHHAHVNERKPAIGCNDTSCHHAVPRASGAPPRTMACHACHTRSGTSLAEGNHLLAEETFHKSCIGCHRARTKGPIACGACHEKS